MLKYLLLFTLSIVLLSSPCTIAQQKPADYVNPFIGTGGHGHTFPGATVPFGMVQLSPDTRLEGWDGCGGYHYSDAYIYGFSHTHLSGTGIPDYGDILIMPFSGETYWNNGFDGKAGYRSKFSHQQETAKAGYYQVRLLDHNINVELSTTARAGIHSYQYPEGTDKKVMIDLKHRDDVTDSWINIVSNNEIEGYRGSNAWAVDHRLYFVIRFENDFNSSTLALDDVESPRNKRIQGKNVKAVFSFNDKTNKPLILKVGISAVSTENARLNLDTEIKDWDFEEVKNKAAKLWNEELGKIEVSSNNADELTIFYTALYHTMISPNLYNDVNNSYLGRDFKEHTVDFNYYTVFSLWDTYRALHPLMTIIDHKRTNDFIRTFLKQYEQGGLLPVWELSSNETWCMIGYHAVPVIADAYIKGIRDYDAWKALEAMRASANQEHFGLNHYKKYGFVPAELEHESVSKTLEYAYDDWCIATMATALGNNSLADSFNLRAQGYKHLFDPQTGFMRARYNGAWFEPFDAREVNFNYTEANSWQYSFYVPHDMEYFIKLHGGKQGLDSKLDALFSETTATTGREQSDITGLIGQYAHGNEPSHHIGYLYNYTGKPWKTQKTIRYIMDNFYTNQPDGLIGNEDCGQMSAWAVLSALGFYPVCPGSTQYVIGTPRFEKSIINLESGKQFTITAENLSKDNYYIHSATLNNKPYTKSYLLHEDIMQGGVLSFIMGNKPNESWGAGEHNEPFTAITSKQVQEAPYLETANQLFDETAPVTITAVGNADIRYTLDGSIPDEGSEQYIQPFIIDKSCTLKFRAYNKDKTPSAPQQAVFIKRPRGLNLTLNTVYAPQYSASGSNSLIDGLKGSEDFRLGGWQGYQGVPIEAIIHLTHDQPVSAVTIGFFQDINAWIFMPERIELWTSVDGKDYKLNQTIVNEVPSDQWGTILKDYTFKTNSLTDRYIMLKAINMGECPSWHKGRGNKAWIFSDEINIEY